MKEVRGHRHQRRKLTDGSSSIQLCGLETAAPIQGSSRQLDCPTQGVNGSELSLIPSDHYYLPLLPGDAPIQDTADAVGFEYHPLPTPPPQALYPGLPLGPQPAERVFVAEQPATELDHFPGIPVEAPPVLVPLAAPVVPAEMIAYPETPDSSQCPFKAPGSNPVDPQSPRNTKPRKSSKASSRRPRAAKAVPPMENAAEPLEVVEVVDDTETPAFVAGPVSLDDGQQHDGRTPDPIPMPILSGLEDIPPQLFSQQFFDPVSWGPPMQNPCFLPFVPFEPSSWQWPPPTTPMSSGPLEPGSGHSQEAKVDDYVPPPPPHGISSWSHPVFMTPMLDPEPVEPAQSDSMPPPPRPRPPTPEEIPPNDGRYAPILPGKRAQHVSLSPFGVSPTNSDPQAIYHHHHLLPRPPRPVPQSASQGVICMPPQSSDSDERSGKRRRSC